MSRRDVVKGVAGVTQGNRVKKFVTMG
jgi:hypothetical protein